MSWPGGWLGDGLGGWLGAEQSPGGTFADAALVVLGSASAILTLSVGQPQAERPAIGLWRPQARRRRRLRDFVRLAAGASLSGLNNLPVSDKRVLATEN